MPDLICPGCETPIIDGYVIVGQVDSIPNSARIVLHAGSLRRGGTEEVTNQIMLDSNSCIAKYFKKDPRNDIYHSNVIPFSDLEKKASE